jgi:hypothetical protein
MTKIKQIVITRTVIYDEENFKTFAKGNGLEISDDNYIAWVASCHRDFDDPRTFTTENQLILKDA